MTASTLVRVASSTCFPPAGILPGALVSLPVRDRLRQPIRWATSLVRTSMRPEAEQRGLPTNQETKMLTAAKFALCAAIVLGTAATASAATKRQKTTAHRGGVRVQTSVPRPAPLVNPFSPAATGGGTPGCNQMLERY